MSDIVERRAYAFVALLRGRNSWGFRALFVGAHSDDEALGCGLRALQEAIPDGEFHVPAVLEVTPQTLEDIGVDLLRPETAAEIARLRADLAAAQERERALLETIERVQAAGEEMRQRLAKHMATLGGSND